MSGAERPQAAMPTGLAAVVVFVASAATLVVEIVALRLLAPYLGLTLETSTAVIALALAAIAIGSWAGGRWADRLAPRLVLPPMIAVAGVAVALTPAVVRAAGSVGNGWLLITAAAASIILPGILLAAVTPMVIKLQLQHLTETGRVVGRLSGIGTVGAIVGTVGTGFGLISRVPVSMIMIGLGLILVLGSAALGLGFRRLRASVPSLVLIMIAAVTSVALPRQCDAETAYHCAQVITDDQRASGRTLVLDGAGHSYVDLEDPTHLEYSYVRALAAAIDTHLPGSGALQAFHLGAGGLTLPRYLDAARPGTRSEVAEIDPGVVALDRDRLGFAAGVGIDVEVHDGRLAVRALASGSQDLVVGDAFGGVSVPWHLTTREAVSDIHRVLKPTGLYAVNVIDHPPLAFARAEAATLATVFDHVVLTSTPAAVSGAAGGNLVFLASDEEIDQAALRRALAERELDWHLLSGPELSEWVGAASVLTDDFAPVDQLLTPYRTR